MNLFWMLYWSILLISLIFSIYIFIKKNKSLGLIQGILTLFFSNYSFFYVLAYRNYTTGQSEIDFIVSSLLKGRYGAIFIVALLIGLVIIFAYNLFRFFIKKNS